MEKRQKQKILYVTLYLPIKNIHGGGNRMHEQIRCLSDKYDIHLISYARDWEEDGIGPLRRFCKEIDVVRVKERNSKSYSLTSPGFIKNYYSRQMSALIHKKIKEIDFDIVQFEYLSMAQYRDSFNIKAKKILTEHQLGFLCLKKEMATEKNMLKKSVLLFRYNRLLRYERKMFKKFDKVIFISGSEAGCAGYPGSFISPMGVDTEYFKPDMNKTEDIDLLYTGNFDNFQNVDSVVYFSKDIWPLIREKRPEINMKIIGVNSREKLGFLKGLSGIDVVGRVEDMRGYLRRAKVFIVPARLGGGMRGKILEALAMGKPVISTLIGAEGYSGDILKAIRIADSPENFAEKTLEVLSNETLRMNMGLISREIVEKEYRWENIFLKMDLMYQDLLKT